MWLRDQPLLVDMCVALAVFALLGLLSWPVLVDPFGVSYGPGVGATLAPQETLRTLDPVTRPLIAAGLVLPLAVRRTAPAWCGGLVAGTSLVQWALGMPIQLAQVGVLVALYALAAYAPRWASRGGLVLGLAGGPMAAVRYFGFDAVAMGVIAIGVCALALAAWSLGDLQRVRRQQMEGLRERARRLEVEREREARLAAADERARIARELHDVVAHSLSVVIAQADGGRYAAADDPSAAVSACETISETGRSALSEMRRLLGVLRSDDGSTRSPTPDMTSIDELIDGVRESGLPVAYSVTGQSRPLPSGVQLAAYRIIQEALTNVLKHAGPDVSAEVRVEWTPAGLMVAIVDDGRGAAADSALRHDEDHGTGHGIPGMTERAELYGGRLQAGPVPGGGFAVRVYLPYRPAETMQR